MSQFAPRTTEDEDTQDEGGRSLKSLGRGRDENGWSLKFWKKAGRGRAKKAVPRTPVHIGHFYQTKKRSKNDPFLIKTAKF